MRAAMELPEHRLVIRCSVCNTDAVEIDGEDCAVCRDDPSAARRHFECQNPRCALNLSPGKVPICVEVSFTLPDRRQN